MAKSFAELRAAQTNAVDSLKSKFDKAKNPGNQKREVLDDTYWSPNHVRGPEGTGYAKIRLLPAPPDGKGGIEPDVFVKYEDLNIKGPGGYYNERSRYHIDQKDPAVEYNKTIWQNESLTKEQKISKIAQKQEYYVVGALIVKDPNAPENEGKTFRWRIGRQIFNIINDTMFPNPETDPDKVPFNVFDPIEGATLTLRVTTKNITGKDGKTVAVPSYEKSTFDAPSPILGGDLDKFQEVWESQYSLQSEVTEDKCKSYDELKTQFDRALGLGKSGKQNFLDSDEPLNGKAQESTKNNKTLSQAIDDDIPDFDTGDSNDEPVKSTKQATSSSDDDEEDWFSKLKS